MIVYFADRQINIIGQATTKLQKGLTISYDRKTEDVETGVAVFECRIPFDKNTRAKVEECTEVGNYILRSYDGENEFYQIIEAEIDTKNQEVYIYAEDDGMDLLNEVVGAYEADEAYPISHYIDKYASAAGFVIGINEVSSLTRKLSWDGESTATARIASVATQFDGCEVSYSFEIDGLTVTKKFINIYRKRGNEFAPQLRLNKEVDRIITKKSIANLATALQCTGGTPEDTNYDDKIEPTAITLKGYSYDDGDFYIDGTLLKSRKALEKWSRLLSSDVSGGHIVKQYSYDTLSQSELCNHAITELKKICDMEINFEADINKLDAKVGDRITIIDDAGKLYLSTRILQLETSVVDQEKKATLGEHLMKGSGISQKVIDLAEQFAKTVVRVERVFDLADTAKDRADAAQDQADAALKDAEAAQKAADAAQGQADTATDLANNAQKAADTAQAAVDVVEENVSSLEKTVKNAKDAAENAVKAATTAEQKAEEAEQASKNAEEDAKTAKEAAQRAEEHSASALENSEQAKATSQDAMTDATAAKETAAAAKADAEQAEKDIENLANTLETVSTTMKTKYARKTELTETEASLQSQIDQNAAQISMTVSKLATIDETANDAQQKALSAQEKASKAKAEANQATAEADAAQAAADEAAKAAADAQHEADIAREAADTARSVADKAEADLAAAQADLETVSSRVDATEEEIAAAEEAVQAAQTTANSALQAASEAETQAAAAQEQANAAVSSATQAQQAADSKAAQAANAQLLADAAIEEADQAKLEAAQLAAAAVVDLATSAQETANTAVANAEAAQQAADKAYTDAIAAQKAAEDADTRADQAQKDLDAAKENLAKVTADASSTAEQIAAAQAAVNTAQAAADEANEHASAAQKTANKAKENAANAQKAADTAKTAADEAQTAADAAQKAADEAQADVNALAVRVTTAETKIVQNSEQIALMASKEEVATTLGNYYTQTETDSQIQIESDKITSSVSQVETVVENNTTRVTAAESEIQQLADMIATLVTDGNGASLMTQTASGWTFSVAEIVNNLTKTASDVGSLSGDVTDINSSLDGLKKAVNDLGVLADYVIITTYNNQPCIELGEGDNDFKLRITNTEIQFADGTTIPAYITNKKLMIEQAEVKNELQFGGFVWKIRNNGNMGLLWKGVS